ncbi:MAG: HTH-type transcriptional regulator CysL [Candidatus Erwinia impunctatus]|nr:HTH-type transcriptional regulator CysL [Culicoides impunctatus]
MRQKKIRITLRQLAVFVEIVNCSSTIQAAAVLSLSQSAVSAALVDLEGHLQVNLFDRVGKRLLVNEYGRLLYPRAVALLERTKEVEELFHEAQSILRVHASSTIGNYILPAMLARWRREHPQLPLELAVGNTQDVVNAVAECRADVGFIEGPSHHPEIVSHHWQHDELVVFCSPDSPLLEAEVSIESIARAAWILREPGSGTRELFDFLLRPQLPNFNLSLELGHSEAIKHAVRHGMGISCLSRRVIEEQLESGALCELKIPFPPLMRGLNRIHHRQKHFSQSLLTLLEYCQVK